MLPTDSRRLRAEIYVAMLGALACVLTFSGRLQSADEIAVYALAYNIAQRGALDVNLLAFTAPGMTAPPFSGIGQFAPDANFYSGKGVLPSLLLLPLLRVSLLVGADPVVAALTLSAVCTVLTACVIARFVRCELGSARAAFLSGALYILGTMALAYSKRLFTEPAAALCVALAFTWLASSARTNYVHLVVAGLAFGGAIAASYANAALLPGFVLLVVLRHRRRVWPSLAGFAAGVVPWLMGLALYNVVRFGTPTSTGLSLLDWSLPYFSPRAAIIRMYGLLLSPYRGFVFYNPIVLLLPAAWVVVAWMRRQSLFAGGHALARLALVVAVAGTIAYLLFFSVWSMWWGGFNWGPRFLLPILPVWLIALGPAFDAMFVPAHRLGQHLMRAVLWLIVVVSVLVASVGGLADTFRSEGELAQRGALGALVKPETLDASPLLTDLGAFQAVVGAGQLVRGEIDTWWARPLTRDEDLMRALSDVGERATPGSAVVLMAPARIEPFLHAYRLRSALVGLAPDQITDGDDAPARRLLSDTARILLLTDAAQLDPGNTTERWWESHAFRARNEFYGVWRVAAFGTPITPTSLITPMAQFGDALVLASIRHSLVVSPGGAVTIQVTWQRTGESADIIPAIAWFAHLLAPDGALIGQHDALIGSGYLWPDGSAALVDHRGILVPTDASPGVYQVRIGAYAGQGGRLPLIQDGQRLPDDVVRFDVHVR